MKTTHNERDALQDKLLCTLGAAARDARTSLGLTQEQVAERLGVSVELYKGIERSVTSPTIPLLARMVLVLKVSGDVLLGIAPAHPPDIAPPTRPDDPEPSSASYT